MEKTTRKDPQLMDLFVEEMGFKDWKSFEGGSVKWQVFQTLEPKTKRKIKAFFLNARIVPFSTMLF